MTTRNTGGIIPSLRYRDAAAAIDFLCDGFGFERHAVYEGPKGSIAHAQLAYAGSMIMLGSASEEGDYDQWVRPPRTRDDVATQGIYVIVPDCDQHCARAEAKGAKIVRPPQDEDYGGRGYTCRDPEGHVWSFGTYDPWAASK
jgi:uncharacterized glyoxalase superfamily protein PhnB